MMQIREELGTLRHRAGMLMVLCLVAFASLYVRLVHLQLINGSYWRRMAENNRLRTLPLESSRGRIYDRSGTLLADEEPTWDVLLYPADAEFLPATVLFLARLGIGNAATLHKLIDETSTGSLAPIIIGEHLSWQQVASIRTHQSTYPELSVVRRLRRVYPAGGVAAHVVGYLRPIRQGELEQHPELTPDALVGATGIEATQNRLLSGRDGERWVVLSAVNQQLGVVRELPPEAGSDLSVTLDLRLQRAVAEAMGDQAGAVVALDPADGAIRAMYSAPSFDPNVFVSRLSQQEWAAIRDDPLSPMQNRCTQGVYPPGSTIKPFLALGGLADMVITPSWQVWCSGSVTLHDHVFRCWSRGGHGRVGLERSLTVSCDTFYYLLGQRMGIERIAYWLKLFGLGEKTGRSFPGERSGVVGTPEWKLATRHQPWYPGEAVSMSIGQGPIDTTLVQMARAYAALASHGRIVTPHLVRGNLPSAERRLPLADELYEYISRGLWGAVHSTEGTATTLSRLPVAGKTGTSQVVRLDQDKQNDDVDTKFRHHAWFVGWAPATAPHIVVAVLIEHGGGGGAVAAPIAAKVFAAALGLVEADDPSR